MRKVYKYKFFMIIMKKENMKVLSILLVSLFFVSLVVGIVAAQSGGAAQSSDALAISEQISNFIKGGIDIIQKSGNPIFSALLGEIEQSEDLFIKILLFLLVMLIVYAVLDTMSFFNTKPSITWLIAIIISIFGIRFVPVGLIKTMTYPASALALVILLGLPFLLFFWIIQRVSNSFVRRAGWAVFAAIIAFLWFYNIDNPATAGFQWIYLFVLIACGVAFGFDAILQKWLGKAKAERIITAYESREINRIKAQLADLDTTLSHATSAEERKQIQGQIKELKENLKSM